MITRIEARGYRCLRSVNQAVDQFEILVGPNASGKSAFLDVLAFLSTLVREGLEKAVTDRTENFHDLVWGRAGNHFRLAIEADVPAARRHIPLRAPTEDHIRYEVEVRVDPEADAFVIGEEKIAVQRSEAGASSEMQLVKRDPRTLAVYNPETNGFGPPFAFPPTASGLHSFTSNDNKFPAAAWLDEFLSDGIRNVDLETEKLRSPSPAYQGKGKKFDGSTLAREVHRFEDKHPGQFKEWCAHLQTSLPDLKRIRTELRPEQRTRYLELEYENGVRVPSWVVSDGTLRLLALTLLAYMPDFEGVYLVEEPENGIHPKAIETVYQSFSSMYQGQSLVVSHSPILLGLARPEQLLCFRKTSEGAEILRGDKHPLLEDWKGEVALAISSRRESSGSASLARSSVGPRGARGRQGR